MSQAKKGILPSKADILAFIGNHPGRVGVREIARAFGLKNALRTDLRQMLRELTDGGGLLVQRKKLHHSRTLPSSVLASIVAQDRDGDLIATPDEWDEEAHGSAPKIRIHRARRGRPGQTGRLGDRVLLHIEEYAEDENIRHHGRIIKIIDHPKHRVLGIFRKDLRGGGRLEPVDKKKLGKEISIPPGAEDGVQEGDLVAVETHRVPHIGLPTGRVVERLGSLTSERAVSLIAIHTHSIPHIFSRDALHEAEAAEPATLSRREDWRHIAFITIDPPDAKDHDDAVHAEMDGADGNNGGFIVMVAIADVAHYVRPNSALDREALLRGNSVYFPDRVVPMLPERISNNLCSLRPNEDRAALAVRMIIGADGRKRSHSFHRIMMRSVARLSYQQSQFAIGGRTDEYTQPLLTPVLIPLYAAYAAMARARAGREPLDLDLPERKILLKGDGTIDRIIRPERLEAHRLIEEFMILANVAAAETLEKARCPLIYRVHDEPGIEQVHALREFLATLGIPFSKSGMLRPAAFNHVLAQIKGHTNEQLVNEIILRTQAQAEYAAENYGHFGLNLRRYAHFTSPIRRYADLVVHRGLISALKLGPDGSPVNVDIKALSEVAAGISATERRAMIAERETNDRLVAHFLADQIGAAFDGRISGVTRAGLFVKLLETGADGFVPARAIGNEYFHYKEKGHAMIGARSGMTYRLGDSVRVKLIEVAPVAGALRFELLNNDASAGGRRISTQGDHKRGKSQSHKRRKAR